MMCSIVSMLCIAVNKNEYKCSRDQELVLARYFMFTQQVAAVFCIK